MKTLPTLTSRLLAATAFCALLATSVPAFAQTAEDLNAKELSQMNNGAPAGPADMSQKKDWHDKGQMQHPRMDVEARIQKLHDQLKITPEQEDKWSAVAGVMRDNAATMEQTFADRKNKTDMTAVEDMQSYHDVIETHATSLQKLIDAFKPLYDSMSPEQQKNADRIFGHKEEMKGPKHGPKHPPVPGPDHPPAPPQP
jgi:hypothetical protein